MPTTVPLSVQDQVLRWFPLLEVRFVDVVEEKCYWPTAHDKFDEIEPKLRVIDVLMTFKIPEEGLTDRPPGFTLIEDHLSKFRFEDERLPVTDWKQLTENDRVSLIQACVMVLSFGGVIVIDHEAVDCIPKVQFSCLATC